jgi:two-component system response regulator ChvI
VVKAVLRRGGIDEASRPAVRRCGAKSMKRGKLTRPGASRRPLGRQACRLTVTEFCCCRARPGPAAKAQPMDAAYDDQVYVDDRTIDSHIKRMRKKFRQVDNSLDAIETLYGVGYRYRES